MTKKRKFFLVVLIVIVIGTILLVRSRRGMGQAEVTEVITPVYGLIQEVVSTTGTVLPKNRLEIKPPVNGRVETILVKEGQRVKQGEVLAWMSNTERAALLDSAREQGEEKLKYWQEVYKPIPLVAPIAGEVIVATTQPGQTVTTNDPVLVLSDQLIVRAQVDETDIGKISIGQKAVVSLDAYPDTKVNSVVGHIYFESKTVNNVTIYEVDVIPENIPEFFRSGMNATVDFIEKSNDHALLLPLGAVYQENGQSYVLLEAKDRLSALKQAVTVGMSDDKNAEILSGVNAGDRVMARERKLSLPKSSVGTNPFMPSRSRR